MRRQIKIDSIVCIGDEYPERRKELLEKGLVDYLRRKAFQTFSE